MFDFDVGKLMIFGIVALAVIPPKDLPRVMRTVGQYVGKMRRMASDFQGQFMDAIKESELDSVRKELDEIKNAAKVDTNFDPANLMRDNMQRAVEGPAPYETVKVDAPAPPAEPAAIEAPEKTASHPT